MHSGYTTGGPDLGHPTMLPSINQEGEDTTIGRPAELLSSRQRRQEVERELDHLFILSNKHLARILRL